MPHEQPRAPGSINQEQQHERLRDFKKFTAKKIKEAIKENPTESRKDWLLNIFKEAGAKNSRNSSYQFWRQDNQPKEMLGAKFIKQKLDYIHNNPVESGIVMKAEEYSSGRDYYYEGKNVGLVEVEFLGWEVSVVWKLRVAF